MPFAWSIHSIDKNFMWGQVIYSYYTYPGEKLDVKGSFPMALQEQNNLPVASSPLFRQIMDLYNYDCNLLQLLC
jgi:hypothetical protein